MNWFRKLMVGRYGGDQLSIFLFALSIVLTITARVAGTSIIMIISYFPLFWAVYRIFSKNIKKRRVENNKFTILAHPVYSKFKKVQGHMKDLKTHRYYRCAKCKMILRVPKGKGKILIKCPKCKNQFTKKT